MNRGYVKVWRKIQDNGILKNHKYCAFVLWSLTKASHKRINIIVGCQPVTLEPGQFVFGRRIAAKELGMSEQEIRTCIELAKKADFLTIKSTNKFSIITIIKWHLYQGSDINEQPSDQPTSNQQATTNKNVKNVKNKTPEEILSEISGLEKRYLVPETINQAFQAISSTRKSNRIADTVKLAILQSWERYPVESIMAGIKTYLEKGYPDQGKDEKYLLGIIRNLKPEDSMTGGQIMKSTGSHALDEHYRSQGFRIT